MPAGPILVTDAFADRYGGRPELAGHPLVVLAVDRPPTDDELAGVEIAWFSPDTFPTRVPAYLAALGRCPGLVWFATLSAGVDHPFFGQLLDRGVRLTTSSGSSAVPIAEGVLAGMLALVRRVPEVLIDQRAHVWQRHTVGELADGRVLVIGLGPIGDAVVARCRAFGMEVEAMRRAPTGHEPVPTHAYAALPDICDRFDWLVVAAPLSPLTDGLVSEAVLQRLRPGARLVNIARGGLVDEPALIEALRHGRLAGAYLDVFAVEPLPDDNPLWDMATVIVTAHASGASALTGHRATEIFLDNLRRYDAGQPLVNEVGARTS